MLWLGIHFPALPLETVMPDAATREQPCVVLEHNRVMGGNPAAMAAGIQPGATLATAHAIAPGLIHARRDDRAERRRLRHLGELLYRFSSQVSLVPPDSLVAEIGASLRLFKSAEHLLNEATALWQQIGAAAGHASRCRVAPTPLAALCLARADTRELAGVPLPDAAIEPEHLRAATIEQLANMGIHTLGQLLALPAAGLAQRFGQGLVDYRERITGTRPDPRDFLQPSPKFRRERMLLSPLRNKQILLAGPMQQLLEELQHWLIAHQLGANGLRWQFADSTRGKPPVVVTVRFSSPEQQSARFLAISRLELERAELPDEVIELALQASPLRPWQRESRSLFGWLPDQPAAPAPAGRRAGQGRGRNNPGGTRNPGATQPISAAEQAELGQLVDQLEARLGRGSCQRLVLVEQHLPESAWQAVSALQTSPARQRLQPLPATGVMTESAARLQALRPLWLFDPPRRISSRQLVILRGPERIESGWWGTARPAAQPANQREESIVTPCKVQAHTLQGGYRDYYVARLGSKAECWVFVDPDSHWFLHGYFG